VWPLWLLQCGRRVNAGQQFGGAVSTVTVIRTTVARFSGIVSIGYLAHHRWN
jgi:hypothetical protein